MWIRKVAFAALVGAFTCGGALAALPAPEQSIETGTGAIVLPRTVGGAIVTRTCGECPALTLRLTESSRLFLGKEQVALPEFIHAVEALSGGRRLTIFYGTKSREITRLVVAGEFSKRPPGGRK